MLQGRIKLTNITWINGDLLMYSERSFLQEAI